MRPRALIGVDLFGQPADWPALNAIAAREGLFTLDDLAQSFGCTLHGRPLGTAADATATSFFPSKPLGAYGDGGALFTESDERAALYRSLRTHGEGTTRYEVLRTGMNGRLDSIQAAVLLAKLTVFGDELAIARTHRALLRFAARQRCGHAGPRAGQHRAPGRSIRSCCAMQRCAITCRRRCARMACRPRSTIRARCICSRPIATITTAHALPVSEDLAQRILALPIHPDLSEADMAHVCNSLLSALC